MGGEGGFFGCWRGKDNLHLIVGAFENFGLGDDCYLPCLGLTRTPAPRWSVGLAPPWPATSCAPTDRFLVRVDLAPWGGSWDVAAEGEGIALGLDAWDLGPYSEYCIHAWLWAGGANVISGLRGAACEHAEGTDPVADLDRERYLRVTLSARP